MNRTVLQIPISTDIRKKAELEAQSQGFSSLQEIIRMFLSKLAAKKIEVTFTEPIQLSEKAIKRYDKMTDEIESGKVKTPSFDNIDALMRHLNK